MNGSRIINPFGGTPGKMSRRTIADNQGELHDKQKEQAAALALFLKAFTSFMRLGFFGRLKWFLFGAKAFKPKDAPSRLSAIVPWFKARLAKAIAEFKAK